MVFGANTYRAFARMLAASTEESEVRDPWVTRMVSLPEPVVSTTLEGPLDSAERDRRQRGRRRGRRPAQGGVRGAVALTRQPVHEPGADGRLRLFIRAQVTLFPVITGQTGLEPIFQNAADFDLELLETWMLDGHTQELIYRPTLH